MIVDIFSRTELLTHEQSIRDLFHDSFDRELPLDLWRWYYSDNPAGPACVSLYFEEDRLIGHYAAIPVTLSESNNAVRGYLSMTTMVHPLGRGRGLFRELASHVNQMLADDGASLICGFPNKNSAPGFAKYLGWKLLDPDLVVDLPGKELLSNPDLTDLLTSNSGIQWNRLDSAQINWRVSKPGANYAMSDGLITKFYDGVRNILMLEPNGLNAIEHNAIYRVLVPHEFQLASLESEKQFAYQFGARVFDPQFDHSVVKREPILSDLF